MGRAGTLIFLLGSARVGSRPPRGEALRVREVPYARDAHMAAIEGNQSVQFRSLTRAEEAASERWARRSTARDETSGEPGAGPYLRARRTGD